jgi:hypothetical protein
METDSKYFPPEDLFKDSPNLLKFVERYKRDGKYPPKLTDYEKKTIDLNGSIDLDGNIFEVVWTLGGRPIRAKRDVEGRLYTFDPSNNKYVHYADGHTRLYLN